MSHLYEDKNGLIHECESGQIMQRDKYTKLVWTKCNKDVPANNSFNSNELATCKNCVKA